LRCRRVCPSAHSPHKETTFSLGARWVSMLFWSFDIAASFLVGYHRRGIVEMEPTKIAMHYLQSWFVLDIFLVGIDWVIIFFITNDDNAAGGSRAARIGKIARGIRAIRLLRLMKFRVIMSDMTTRFHSEETRTGLYITKLIIIIVFVNHFLGCGFYGLQFLVAEQGRTWVAANFEHAEHDTWYRYWTSLHWSLTQFTPASMEVNAVNTLERSYTVCVLLFALVTFSSFVSSITTAMTHLRTTNARKLEQDVRLRRFLTEHNTSAELTSRVIHFTHERAIQRGAQARTQESEVELFQVLPESLKEALRMEAYSPSIMVHPLMNILSTLDNEVIAELCKKAVSERRLVVQDELYGHGQEVTHTIFVINGFLSYTYILHGTDFADTLEAKTWACEIALWASSPELSQAFVATRHTDLAMVKASEFRSIMQRKMIYIKSMFKYAAAFVQQVHQISVNCRSQSVMCNEFGDAKDRVELAFGLEPLRRKSLNGGRKSWLGIGGSHIDLSELT